MNANCIRLYQVCRTFEILSSQRMPDRLTCQSILLKPLTGSEMQFWNEIGLCLPEMMAQRLSKQLVAHPLRIVETEHVDRTDEGLSNAPEQAAQNAINIGACPTVECEPPPSRFWSTTMASASGWDSAAGSYRINRLKFSFSSRKASLAMVSNTIDDFPEPETPVKIVILRLGMRKETFFKLFSRAPRTSMYS
jgi:hypothetical protein